MQIRELPFSALPLSAVLIVLLAVPAPPAAARPVQEADPDLPLEQPEAPGTEDVLDPTEAPAAGAGEPGEAIDQEDLEAVDEVMPAAEPEGPVEVEEEPAVPEEDRAADFYLSRCAGCHTIGEGALSGPDLAPSTGWPAPDLATAVERMEKNVGPMTEEQVQMLVELLKSDDVEQRLSAARERQVAEMAASLEPPSAEAGRELFHGGESFTNNGMPCSACHRAGEKGGTLAADLTDAYDRLGEQAVMSAAETPGFPLMKASYGNRPVTRQEALHLTAYLEQVSERAADAEEAGTPAAPPTGARFAWWGAGAALLFLAAMIWLYRGRNRGVRAGLVREAHSR